MTPPSGAVRALLEQARGAGFLGPGSLGDHVTSATAFLLAAGEPPRRALDLGSGGGVPGLLLAEWWAETEMALLDRSHRRAAFLRRAVLELGWAERVAVVHADAEVAGRDPALRATVDVVTARSFGPPAVVAECGAPFLRPGGRLLVAEPPQHTGRWPADALERVGLTVAQVVAAPARVQVLELRRPVDARYPRRPGIPAKRPLW